MGRRLLERRLARQASLWARKTHQGEGIFKLEQFFPLNTAIWTAIRLSGLGAMARRNCLDVRIVRRDLPISSLPEALNGFRLLQISDLHCDLEPAIVNVVIRLLGQVEYDAVVLTGDYHNKIGRSFDLSLDLMSSLIPHLRVPRFGILGNHDFIEKVSFLEAAGLPILLNESALIEYRGAHLWICGVDDPHYFRTEDLARARMGVPSDHVAILLSHTSEPYREAESLGYRALLCGHTHGGQICLPGGFSLLCNVRAPRAFLKGPWRFGRLSGYTSPGTGCCGVPARFFCPPEITLHTLRPMAEVR